MSKNQTTGHEIPLLIVICTAALLYVLFTTKTYASATDIQKNTGRKQLVSVNRYGQKYNAVPDKAVASMSAIEPDKNAFGDRMYVVQPGETGGQIARETTGHARNWSDIADYNQVSEHAALSAGRLLYIPSTMVSGGAGRHSSVLEGSQHGVVPAGDQQENDSSWSNHGSNNSLALEKQGARAVQSIPDDAQLLAMAVDNQQGLPLIQTKSTSIVDLTPNSRDGQVVFPAINDHSRQKILAKGHRVTERNVDMFAGQAQVFGKVAVDRVAVGNGAILRAEILDDGDLLAIAQAEGSSSLHLWHKDGSHSNFNIRVSANDPQIRVRLDKTVRMRVKMIEFRKSALERLGIDWGDSIEGPLFATVGDAVTNSLYRPSQSSTLGESSTLPLAIQPFSSYFGIATQLSSRINMLVNRGDAEMLAEPVLSCGNGGTARFLAGGEVPYPTVGANGQTTVSFREYGIRLEISPRVDEFNNIQADIMTEVSSIDSSVTVMGAPGLLTRRTQTQVSTLAGNTIVIAGLMQLEQGQDNDSLPGLGRLPVLGKLFGSDSNRNSVSELVIFITPEVTQPGQPGLTPNQKQTHQYVSNSLDVARRQIQKTRAQY